MLGNWRICHGNLILSNFSLVSLAINSSSVMNKCRKKVTVLFFLEEPVFAEMNAFGVYVSRL